MTAHADMNLRDYVRAIVPTVKLDSRKYHLAELCRAVDSFCDWLKEDIAVADVTPEMLNEFTASAKPKWLGYRLKTVMRTFDPIKFRIRSDMSSRRLELDKGNGSEFLLANVYANQYEPLALRSRRPNTKRLYVTTLRTFDKFLKRSATLDDLNDDAVSKYATWRGRRINKRSVNKDLFNLLAMWRWCNRKGMVESWPDVQLEKPPARTPVAWAEADLRKLYAAMVALPGRVGKHRAKLWWPALLLTLWDSAERISAVMALTWDRVDLESRWVVFRAEERKGAREDSAVRLSKETIAALKKIRGDREEVFPWPYSRTYLWYVLTRILESAGLPMDARSKFHRIRRTVASYAEAAGANATVMLRHSKREITEAYIDPKICKRQQPADVLFRLSE
jgi:integrase